MPRQHKLLKTGDQFGRLTVIRFEGFNSKFKQVYECVCSCGGPAHVEKENLVHGGTKSCGCIFQERGKCKVVRHGLSGKPEYQNYKEARKRCRNPRSFGYAFYGGRGIEFRFDSFVDFYEAVGDRPTPLHTLDRIDSNGHYEKGNVRWATRAEQALNRRPRNRAKASVSI